MTWDSLKFNEDLDCHEMLWNNNNQIREVCKITLLHWATQIEITPVTLHVLLRGLRILAMYGAKSVTIQAIKNLNNTSLAKGPDC